MISSLFWVSLGVGINFIVEKPTIRESLRKRWNEVVEAYEEARKENDKK
jgi:biotin-(acetyl-CoA carboxylase) ligase